MKMSASEFKAKCLAVLDAVNRSGEAVTITKRGKVVARLVPDTAAVEKPWLKLKGKARWVGDPLEPVVDEKDIRVERD
jgi:prevent-host-death family protein